MEEHKKHRRDRKDAWYLADMDSMHIFLANLLPNRTDNEGVMEEDLDLSAVEAYVAEKNAQSPAFKYTMFHVLCAAIAKTIVLRPCMNRFVADGNMYERKNITLCFLVKKQFVDGASESVAIVKIDPDSQLSPMEQIHSQVEKIVTDVRVHGKTDDTTVIMDKLVKLPKFLFHIFIKGFLWVDRKGLMPMSLQKADPYYTSCFLTNLGSIKMRANYHHLSNYGTNSFFACVGEMKKLPVYGEDGTVTEKHFLPVAMTLDERIADGTYYARSLRLIRSLFANPTLLDAPVSTPVEYK